MSNTVDQEASGPSTNGSSMTTPPDVGAVGSSLGTSQRTKQLPWVALGVLLVAGSMIGFALWTVSQGERTPAVVAARDIDAGSVVQEADLAVVSIGADNGAVLLDAGDAALVVGEVARGPIPAGTPMSSNLVTEVGAVPDGEAVLGTSLSPGEYPTGQLRAGDRVLLIETLDGLATQNGDEPQVVGRATVWSVEELLTSNEPRLFVSLLVPEVDVPRVANLESQGRLRLVLVGPGS